MWGLDETIGRLGFGLNIWWEGSRGVIGYRLGDLFVDFFFRKTGKLLGEVKE